VDVGAVAMHAPYSRVSEPVAVELDVARPHGREARLQRHPLSQEGPPRRLD